MKYLCFLLIVVLSGCATTKRHTLTIEELQTRAEAGDTSSQLRLANINYDGLGTKVDRENGCYWADLYSKNKEASDANTITLVGMCRWHGQYIEKDIEKAKYLFEKSSALGDNYALYMLGGYYLQGKGGYKNVEKAAAYILKAAEGGVSSAQYWMGLLYFNGKGVEYDRLKAFCWFERASLQQHEKATKSYISILEQDGYVSSEMCNI